MVNPQQEPTVGDRVWVPWGLEDIEGEILDVYPSGLGVRARVRLVEHEEESIVTVPLDTLVKLDTLPTGRERHGSEYERRGNEYEQIVHEALAEALASLDPLAEMFDPRDRGVDAVLRSKNRTLYVQMKSYPPGRKVSSDAVSAAAGLVDRRASALLITNEPLTKEASRRLDILHRNRKPIWHVLWRGPEDNKRLALVTRRALAGSAP
jgi:hypothetical protein